MPNLPQTEEWTAFVDCSVIYEGRAYSELKRDFYLIIFKSDKSISIHGSTLIQPRNYLAKTSSIISDGDVHVFNCGKEKLIIEVFNVISSMDLCGLSKNKISICRTEKELAIKLVNNLHLYYRDIEIVYNEYNTDLGIIDIFARSETTDYIIEVKRGSCSLKDVNQLMRYIESHELNCALRPIIGCLASPIITKSAHKYLKKHGFSHIAIDFD